MFGIKSCLKAIYLNIKSIQIISCAEDIYEENSLFWKFFMA